MTNFTEIRPVKVAFIQADRRIDRRTDRGADMTKVIGAFRDYANEPESSQILH
jgi:hypothetical protein